MKGRVSRGYRSRVDGVPQPYRLISDAFQLYISQLVVDEAGAGDPVAARKRLKGLQDLPLLDITPEVAEVASSKGRGPGEGGDPAA